MYERNAHRSAPTTQRNQEHPDIFLALASTTVFSVMDGPKNVMQLRLRPAHDGKNHGRSEGEENFGEFPVTVGGRGPRDARFSHTRTRVCEALALTETE